ncbi:MAG TPA: hypothetical protein VIG48_11085 [Jatrophihabitans sp.]|jgi:hypothetical protein
MQPTPVADQPLSRAGGLERGSVLGGLLMLSITTAPALGYPVIAGDHPDIAVRVVAAIWQVLTIALLFLLAPVVGWRRRDMWWTLLPLWGPVIAWRLGVRLGAERPRA